MTFLVKHDHLSVREHNAKFRLAARLNSYRPHPEGCGKVMFSRSVHSGGGGIGKERGSPPPDREGVPIPSSRQDRGTPSSPSQDRVSLPPPGQPTQQAVCLLWSQSTFLATARIRSTREGNVYTWECLSTRGGGTYLGWRGTYIGGYLSWPWGDLPWLGGTYLGQGVPTLDRGVPTLPLTASRRRTFLLKVSMW